MKNSNKLSAIVLLLAISFGAIAQGIQPDLQYYRAPGYKGLNVFETGKKTDEVPFDGFKVRLGGDFALQFQGLDQSFDPVGATNIARLQSLSPSVNLPTANLNIDAQIANGMRMHLRTYLSARHHNDSWVKGGYIQVDRLDFVQEGFLDGVMDLVTLKIGVDNFNYGDAVFRRSDNAMAIYNPFVGNYLMDNNTVEPFAEVYVFPGDFIVTAGISTGILNPTVVRSSDDQKMPPSFHSKIGWDSQIDDDLRIRLTGSVYIGSGYSNSNHLYAGDRAGARYYNIFGYVDNNDEVTSGGDFAGRVNPGFNNNTSFQINPFVKWKGFEFFGVFEMSSGYNEELEEDNDWTKGTFTQIGAEVLYRFGSWEQFYVGGRYNNVSGFDAYETDQPDAMVVDRLNIGGGWFFTNNVLMKLEYVSQNYNDQWAGSLQNGKFNGVMIEAIIGF